MKTLVTFILLCLFIACQEKATKQDVKADPSIDAPKQEMTLNQYPPDFAKVLTAHGGIDKWKMQKTIKFTIGNLGEAEQHIVDLNTRMDKTVTSDYEMGYDGEDVWVNNKDGKYEGNAAFMHNLMFYFYTMPFILSDNGANYEKTPDKEINGKSYRGIKVTFDSGIGVSSGDEYYLYYDPETYQMDWLAYKATFGSDKKPEWPNYISYDKWAEIDGVLLPTSIAWHRVDQGEVKEEKSRVHFNNISLSKEAEPKEFYLKSSNTIH
tara:strand:- start:4103 stop:4897 length:795 start_codon:yes stop_codon:yes gene_type:complete